MDKTKSPASSVPRSRFERQAHLGGLAGRVVGSMLAEGMRQVARGNLPRPADLVLTPANARRVADKLSELRGAAMKVGQLLSMDAGDFLPADLAAILAGLRADARPMRLPPPQSARPGPRGLPVGVHAAPPSGASRVA